MSATIALAKRSIALDVSTAMNRCSGARTRLAHRWAALDLSRATGADSVSRKREAIAQSFRRLAARPTENLRELDNLFQEYVEVGGEAFACIIGTDGLVYPAMMVGGVGVVSAVANPFPELMVALYDAVIAKQYERARKLQLLVNQLRVVLKIGPYLAGYKEIMRLRGRQFPLDMKAPLRGLNDKETAEIHAAFESLPKAVFDPSLVK